MGHAWIRDKDGNIDLWAFEDFNSIHHGPVCKKCYYSFCVECDPDGWDKQPCSSNNKTLQWKSAGVCDIKCPNCKSVFSDELFCMGKNTMQKDDIKYCPGCGVKIGYEEYFGQTSI